MTDKQICDRIKGVLSASMMPMEMELECNRFLDRCLDSRWIPVEERLSTRYKTVLAVDRVTGKVDTAYLNIFDSFVFCDGRGHGASHWMPLPEPPGKDVSGGG